jgi:glycine/D-amino acid oxidase-like deaminating enzyme
VTVATPEGVAVIGAGIVGATTALYLRRAGHEVTVFDPLPPAGGASFGNAGMISPDSCTPIASPGMLRKVPGWLRDPLGPLAIRPGYFVQALPWLLKWIAAGRFDRVIAGSDALRALHVPAFDCYRELLGTAHFNDLIRINGQIYFWEGATTEQMKPVREAIRARHNLSVEPLDLDTLRQMVPALTREASQAIILPKNGHTVNPGRLVQTIAQLFRDAGGLLRHENVLKLLHEDGAYRLVTNAANHRFARVVVAAGAWSQRLLRPLGVRLPLETERGYHVTIPNPNVSAPPMPVLCYNKPFGLSPIEGGIRLAGTVEIAGLDAPMNEQRALILIRRAKTMLPALEVGEYSMWMGHRPSFPDSLPVIGEAPGHPRLFLAFGHGHSGLTGGPPTGRLIAQLIGGRQPSIDLAPFSPARFGT